MKVIEPNTSVISGIPSIGTHTIAKGSESHIISLVRDKLYPNPAKAALCETICNAVDEHRRYNIKRPVEVIITKSEIVIRDYARGLAEEDVINVFFAFGASTKNTDDEAIGGFGIGAKAPSAYASSWMVESRYNGTHTCYITTLDGNEGVIGKLSSKPCDEKDTGITVRIPFQQESDVNMFMDLAVDMYKQIGFFRDEEELVVYDAKGIGNYSKFLAGVKSDSSLLDSCILTGKNSGHRPFKDLRHNDPLSLYVKDVGFFIGDSSSDRSWRNARTSHSDSCMPNFVSSFFTTNCCTLNDLRIRLYDGDMCYSVTIGEKAFTAIEKSIRYYATWERISRCYIRQGVVIFVPKGTFAIAPNREQLITSDKLTNYVTLQIKKLFDVCEQRYHDLCVELLQNKDLDMYSRMRTAANSMIGGNNTNVSFIREHCNVLCHTNSMSSCYRVASDTILSSNTDTETLTGEVAGTSTKRVRDVYKMVFGRDIASPHILIGVLINSATDNNDGCWRSAAAEAVLAKAALLHRLEHLSEAQKAYYNKYTKEYDVVFLSARHAGWKPGDNYDCFNKTVKIGHIDDKSVFMSAWTEADIIDVSQLTPYVDRIKNAISKKRSEAIAAARANKERSDKKSTKVLISSTTSKIIPEDEFENTLLYTPSESKNWEETTWFHALLSDNYSDYSFIFGPIKRRLGFTHVAKCLASEVTYFERRGATRIASVNWRQHIMEELSRKSILFIPQGLNVLLHCCDHYTDFIAEHEKNGHVQMGNCLASYSTRFSSYTINKWLSCLPGNDVVASDKNTPVTNLNSIELEKKDAFLKVMSKLSITDKIKLADAVLIHSKSTDWHNTMLSIANHPDSEFESKLKEKKSKTIQAAKDVLINKILPKLDLVWKETSYKGVLIG